VAQSDQECAAVSRPSEQVCGAVNPTHCSHTAAGTGDVRKGRTRERKKVEIWGQQQALQGQTPDGGGGQADRAYQDAHTWADGWSTHC